MDAFHAARTFLTVLRVLLIAVVTAPNRAIAHVIPHVLPFFSALEGSPTDRANLAGAIGMMGHWKWLGVVPVFYPGDRLPALSSRQ